MFYYEIELNRGWIYDTDEAWWEEKVIGEKNFVVPAEYYYALMADFGMTDAVASDFLDYYDPEIDGKLIYEFALRAGAIIEEGDHYYGMTDDILRGCILQSYEH